MVVILREQPLLPFFRLPGMVGVQILQEQKSAPQWMKETLETHDYTDVGGRATQEQLPRTQFPVSLNKLVKMLKLWDTQ